MAAVNAIANPPMAILVHATRENAIAKAALKSKILLMFLLLTNLAIRNGEVKTQTAIMLNWRLICLT